ncbi:hypothetical protein ACSBR1_037483 [Camellia fascicularis]
MVSLLFHLSTVFGSVQIGVPYMIFAMWLDTVTCITMVKNKSFLGTAERWFADGMTLNDFLNRLVREHGSIDLEWLRDVPPDKVKEYLLSVRGLGLKSVECVRLLTLHHLTFPVDTNVGRIVVRLGWVPLQPLPESLQLHLLELYPVLESIQRYLWPRLCKLDQRTLKCQTVSKIGAGD